MLGLSKLEAYGIILLVVTLAAGTFGFYEHHQGYLAGKQEIQTQFDKFKNDVTAAGLKAAADELAKKRAQDKITREQEMRHAQEDAVLNARYAAATSKLRGYVQAKGSSGGGSLQPIPAAASVCNDAAKDKRFLDAFSFYRNSVLGLLQTCESQTSQLSEAQAWIKAQQAVK